MLLKQKIPKSVVIVGVPEKCASGTTPPNASVYNVGRNKTFALAKSLFLSLGSTAPKISTFSGTFS